MLECKCLEVCYRNLTLSVCSKIHMGGGIQEDEFYIVDL